uniref:Uncharacterized protein n=1 Tax=Arundo donax TaxID=35708 RepID=A0A0A9FN89_ARUDO
MMECQGGCSSCRRRRFHLRHPRWGGEAYIFIPDSEDEDGDEVVANETGDGEDLFFIPDSKYVGMEAAVDDDLTFIPDSEATGVEAASGDFDVHDEGGVHALDVVVHEGGAQGKLALNVEDDEGGVHAVVGKNGMGSEDELVATVDIGGYSQDPYEDVDVNLEVGVEAEPYIDDDFVKQMLQVLVPSG